MTTRAALVLAGGGTAGVSWTYGLLSGLADAGRFDASDFELIVGTSAGAVVGANLAAGADLAALADEERRHDPDPSSGSFLREVDPAAFGAVFTAWMGTDPMTVAVAREIGARAVASCSMPPQRWVDGIARKLAVREWSPRLIVTAVACDGGERVTWSARDGVDLLHAVAASSAVPTIAPAIPIGDRRYMDGGVWSVTNADVLLGTGVTRALIVCPQTGPLKDIARSALARDTAALEGAGVDVTSVVPGEAYEALGPNVMDPRLRAPAVEAGMADARAVAPGWTHS